MKYLLILATVFICEISFGQKMAQINLKDSCLMSGGIIQMKDFKRLNKLCLPQAKKITSFIISYPENPPLYLELRCVGNRWDSKFIYKKAKPGVTFIIEEINAIGHDGKSITVQPLIVGFK